MPIRPLTALLCLLAAPHALACAYDPAAFKAYDTNSDGFITEAEITPILQKQYDETTARIRADAEKYHKPFHNFARPPKEEWQRKWLVMDTDHDTRISQQEADTYGRRTGDTLKCL